MSILREALSAKGQKEPRIKFIGLTTTFEAANPTRNEIQKRQYTRKDCLLLQIWKSQVEMGQSTKKNWHDRVRDNSTRSPTTDNGFRTTCTVRTSSEDTLQSKENTLAALVSRPSRPPVEAHSKK